MWSVRIIIIIILVIIVIPELFWIKYNRRIVDVNYSVKISDPNYDKRKDYIKFTNGIICVELRINNFLTEQYPCGFVTIIDGKSPDGTEQLYNNYADGGYSTAEMPTRKRISVVGKWKISEVSYGNFEVKIEFTQEYKGLGVLASLVLPDNKWIIKLTSDIKRRLTSR
jgi:hypothetical protein